MFILKHPFVVGSTGASNWKATELSFNRPAFPLSSPERGSESHMGARLFLRKETKKMRQLETRASGCPHQNSVGQRGEKERGKAVAQKILALREDERRGKKYVCIWAEKRNAKEKQGTEWWM